jgi:hypothetical protein
MLGGHSRHTMMAKCLSDAVDQTSLYVAIVLPKAQNISTHYTSDVTPDYLDIMSLFSSFMYCVHICCFYVILYILSVLTQK